MDGGAWQATLHRVANSCTPLKRLSTKSNTYDFQDFIKIFTESLSRPTSLPDPTRYMYIHTHTHIYTYTYTYIYIYIYREREREREWDLLQIGMYFSKGNNVKTKKEREKREREQSG